MENFFEKNPSDRFRRAKNFIDSFSGTPRLGFRFRGDGVFTMGCFWILDKC